MDITFIDNSGEKEMNDLKIGDRVKVVLGNEPIETSQGKIINGATGTVKDLDETYAGVEFDEDIGGHCGDWNGKGGYCWYIIYERLEKIEETGEETAVDTEKETKEEAKEEVKEETKADTLEQKILEVLREEIGVKVGEAFDVYENGRKKWMCKFEENGHLVSYKRGGFEETFIWKYWVFHFDKYTFKKKQFIPEKYYSYYYVRMSYTENDELIFDGIDYAHWEDSAMDIAMLSVGNVFATEREAAANKEKVLGTVKKCLQNVIG